jgi:hypothetical protein
MATAAVNVLRAWPNQKPVARPKPPRSRRKRAMKSWGEFSGAGSAPLDFVFTVCDNAAGEACPYWPGQPMTAHWGVPDPAAATGNEVQIRLAFANAFRMLSNRISLFVSLPLRALDKLTLQRQLDSIGAAKDSAA